ncbi:MAG: helix-turn-helix transcriptional regulator [Marinicellaceae bacterium]
MEQVEKGSFFGSHYQKSIVNEIILTDTEYTHNKVDWHQHENPYFTYILQGKLYEASHSHEHYLESGGLLYHNWQDSHFNLKPEIYTRGFHVELSPQWFSHQDVSLDCIEGNHLIQNPVIKSLMTQVFIESKINDLHSQISIDALMTDILSLLTTQENSALQKRPSWFNRLNEIIVDSSVKLSLNNLSHLLNIHPVHLSREFHKYFGTTFGQYIRYKRVNKAFNLILNSHYSLTEICYECDYYDQSHLIRDFKRIFNQTPGQLIKHIKK